MLLMMLWEMKTMRRKGNRPSFYVLDYFLFSMNQATHQKKYIKSNQTLLIVH